MKQVRVASQHFWSDGRTFATSISWWRRPIVGYIAACLGAAVGIGMTRLGDMLFMHFTFSVSSFLIVILLVSLLWGVGPGLLAMLLSCVAFSYLVVFGVHPEPSVSHLSWILLIRLIPFVMASLAITAIACRHEISRRLLQKRADELSERADELSIMNQELERANHLKDYFMIRAAHELRTPLTPILGETQLALRRLHKADG
ncbi:MAG TPA: hypothetical protein VHZ51_05050, partial [Ktedonobacteraceae bacterium]|nr:hypothetical protein [Ktedonobacteraceae bacterium]